jgi:hypothetical protein
MGVYFGLERLFTGMTLEHPYPRGTLVKIKTHYMVIHGDYRTMGHLKPQTVYQDPNYVITDGWVVGPGRDPDGLLTGLVVRVREAEDVAEAYKEEPRHIIYQVLTGDNPPLWFSWRDIQELEPSDDDIP